MLPTYPCACHAGDGKVEMMATAEAEQKATVKALSAAIASATAGKGCHGGAESMVGMQAAAPKKAL